MKHKIKRRGSVVFLVLTLLCTLTVPAFAAEGDSETEDNNTNVSVTGVSLNKTELSLEAGKTETLTATVAPDDATDKTVTWESSDTKVATVDGGNVTGVAEGTATITVTTEDGSKTAECKVTVTEAQSAKPVTGVDISTSSNQNKLNPKDTLAMSWTVSPSDAANKAVTWTSSDPEVAAVSETGVVTAVAPGKATITVTTAEGGKTDTYELEVSGIVLDPTTLELLVNGNGSLAYHCYGAAAGRNVTWHSDNPGVADVTVGRVTGRFPGSTTVTATVYGTGYHASCNVTVEEDVAQAINVRVDNGQTYSFSDLRSALSSRCREKTGAALDYLINLSVSTDQGTLYYGYVSPDAHGHGVGGTEKYYDQAGIGQMPLSDVLFVPRTDFSGVAVISYQGCATNGKTFNGTVRVEVADADDVAYMTASDQPLHFTAEQFTAVCQEKTGRSVKYLTFEQPSASRGTLYYKYSPTAQFSQQVNSDTKYYTTSFPSVENVTFVPAEGFRGTVSIPYTCVDSAGSSYRGKVTVTVYAPDGTKGEDVKLATGAGEPVALDAADFNDVCWEVNGTNLHYIYFDLPRSREGTLYYDYVSAKKYGSRVSAATRYYRSTNPRISRITFVPQSGFTGTVAIPFTAYDTWGGQFSGTLRIEVGASGNGTVTYTTLSGGTVDFDAVDFNAACRDRTGSSLSYVRFEQPSTRYGTLYYQYSRALGTGTRVNSSTSYYRSGSGRRIDDVTFAAAPGYVGTVDLDYTGRSSSGETFSGVVQIKVNPGTSNITFRFSDVPAGAYYYDAVQWAVNRDITGGISTTAALFGPEVNCTRAQAVTFLWRAAGSPAPRSSGNPFRDVSPSAYYYDAVRWAVEQGITTGDDSGGFSPDTVITRGQVLTLLHRYAGLPAPRSNVNPFRDVSGSAYYCSAVLWAAEQGITTGNGSGAFNPDSIVTRSQMVTFLYRALAW